MDILTQCAAIFFDSYPRAFPLDVEDTRAPPTRTTQFISRPLRLSTVGAAAHVYLVSSLKQRKSSRVCQRLPLGPREATPVESGTSAGVPPYRPSVSYTMHPQALVAYFPVVAIAKLLIPLQTKTLVHWSRLIKSKQGVVQWRLHAYWCLS